MAIQVSLSWWFLCTSSFFLRRLGFSKHVPSDQNNPNVKVKTILR